MAANRSAIARLGGLSRAARYDGRAITAPARATFLSRFEREVDPAGLLDPTERARRAEHAKRAYFLRLALRSARVRRERKRRAS